MATLAVTGRSGPDRRAVAAPEPLLPVGRARASRQASTVPSNPPAELRNNVGDRRGVGP